MRPKQPSKNRYLDYFENYIGETVQSISQRVKDPTGKDVNSHLFKYAVESGYEVLYVTNNSIAGKCYRNNTRKLTLLRRF